MTGQIRTPTGGVTFSNTAPIVLIAGVNVLESEELAAMVADHLAGLCTRLAMPLVFKASFDKANRSSGKSYRGPGLRDGLAMLVRIKERHGLPILTDVHEPRQAAEVAEVADILQLPAFLARQTDLVAAIARTGAVVNVKKPQFLAPWEMRHILEKFAEYGNRKILLCERGSCFGYNNLVVDMLGMDMMKDLAPVVFDVTHALQKPGARADSADGRGTQAAALARSGIALGIAGLFLETHPDPVAALCDGPSATKLADVEALLRQVQAIDGVVKNATGDVRPPSTR